MTEHEGPRRKPDACAWCGAQAARVRRTKAQISIACGACRASTPTYQGVLHADRRALDADVRPVVATCDLVGAALEAAWFHWRHAPLTPPPATPKQFGVSARSVRPRRGEEPRDPLELLAKLMVPGSYRVPVEGRSSRPGMQAADVAAALALIRDRLAKAVALAVVLRADDAYIAHVVELARWRVRYQVMLQRPLPLKLSQPADRWKLRLALFDAAYELVWPEKRTPYSVLARRARTRKQDYMVVHRCATHVLQDAMNEARAQLRHKLYG